MVSQVFMTEAGYRVLNRIFYRVRADSGAYPFHQTGPATAPLVRGIADVADYASCPRLDKCSSAIGFLPVFR